MRKLIVGLLAVGLLAVAAPAMAIDSGMGDSLGLIASGAVFPFVGGGTISPGSQSFLEVTSPVGGNGNFHMFFFDVTCQKGPKSVGLPLTANDVEVIRIDNADPSNPVDGLITAAGANASGQNLQPLNNPIHARVYWVTAQGFIRVLEPIGLNHGEFPGQTLTWNPLRTGASFFAPLENAGTHTTLYLICPRTTITTCTGGTGLCTNSTAGTIAANTSVFPAPQFPELVPPASTKATPLQARVYDDEEGFLRNYLSSCDCLTASAVTTLDAIYSDPVNAPFGTYTEIETTPVANGNSIGFSFTGYKAIHIGGNAGPGSFDVFSRLDNANFNSQQGTLTQLER